MDISQALEAVSKSETIKLKQIIENYAAANSLEAVHDEVRILKSGKNYCLDSFQVHGAIGGQGEGPNLRTQPLPSW